MADAEAAQDAADLAHEEALAADDDADATLEEAANKEVTEEVEFTINYYLDVAE